MKLFVAILALGIGFQVYIWIAWGNCRDQGGYFRVGHCYDRAP